MDKNEKSQVYGSIGWREFADVRSELLNAVESSKARNTSRPVPTAHGVAAEAQFRKVLSEYLPGKYGVASGYIIPNFVAEKYRLDHYDVIIYDKLNSPVLWIEGNADDSDQGKKRAIPIEYVLAVYEIKASLTKKAAMETVKKLESLNRVSEYLPNHFHCGCVFFVLPDSTTRKDTILKQLIKLAGVHGYKNGLVLSCSANNMISASIDIHKNCSKGQGEINSNYPLSRDTDDIKVTRTESGIIIKPDTHSGSVGNPGAMLVTLDGGLQVSKTYAATYYDDQHMLAATWSKNGFSRFFLDLLALLEGVDPSTTKYTYAQIFDHLEME